jgi:hypothetical protein
MKSEAKAGGGERKKDLTVKIPRYPQRLGQVCVLYLQVRG